MIAAADASSEKFPREATAAYAIEIESMSAWVGDTEAVRNLSLHVPRGSVYGLVGPNGAGKTTTIRTLATLHQPDAGTVLVDGIDVRADPAAVRGRIGYLPDFSGVYEGLTVSEYVDFYGAIHQIPLRRRRQLTDELLELVNLADERESPVKRLSRGMRQRLGLVRCLIHDPQILLLDEPASGMDPLARVELREILQELVRLSKTVLISSHALSELAEVCTHLGIIYDGELLAEGSVDEILGAVSETVRLRVRLLDAGNRELAWRLLEEQPACREIEARGELSLLATFTGAEQDLAVLLGQLVTAGAQVTEFALERPTLEEVFLQLTEAEAQA
jgi:ABC-2 type transport system ATP-binding protein